MSKVTIGASLIAVIAAGLAFFSFLNPCFMCDACRRADIDVSEDGTDQEQPSAVMNMVMTGFGEKKAPLTLFDFPAAADMPAVQFASRPRRPVYLTSIATPSAGILSFIAGGQGAYRSKSAASVTYGVRLQLDLAQDETDLKQRFLLGGDAGGADIMAISLERFIANLPELMQIRPKIFLLLSYSRGSVRLVSIGDSDIAALKNSSISYVPGDGGRYFLAWRLLKEGIDPESISWRQESSQNNVLRALKSGKARVALLQTASLGSSEENLIQNSEIQDEGGEALECEGIPSEEIPLPSDVFFDGGTPELADQKPEKKVLPEVHVSGSADISEPDKFQLRRLASTADAPFLSPLVLIVRGDFAARYPEVLRRTAKAVIAEGSASADFPLSAARRMRDIYPDFENPEELLALLAEEPAATLAENRAFFGLSRSSAPVSFKDLLHSQIRVLRSMGALSGDIRGTSAETLFLKTPIESLSDKIIASAKTASRAARQKGRIKDILPAQNSPPQEAEPTSSAQEESEKQISPAEDESDDQTAVTPEEVAADVPVLQKKEIAENDEEAKALSPQPQNGPETSP